jgi:hypothetical protein
MAYATESKLKPDNSRVCQPLLSDPKTQTLRNITEYRRGAHLGLSLPASSVQPGMQGHTCGKGGEGGGTDYEEQAYGGGAQDGGSRQNLPRQPHELGRQFELQTDKAVAARTFVFRMGNEKIFRPCRHHAKTDAQRQGRQKHRFLFHGLCKKILQRWPLRVNKS